MKWPWRRKKKEELPELPHRVAHARLDMAVLHVCAHSGDSLVAALRDARLCAGVPASDKDLVMNAVLMEYGMSMTCGDVAFVANGMRDNPWGFA